MLTYTLLESIATDLHSQHSNKDDQQKFNHVGDYLDSIRVSKNSCRVHMVTIAISMTVFKSG
jgi:hypothetical protein